MRRREGNEVSISQYWLKVIAINTYVGTIIVCTWIVSKISLKSQRQNYSFQDTNIYKSKCTLMKMNLSPPFSFSGMGGAAIAPPSSLVDRDGKSDVLIKQNFVRKENYQTTRTTGDKLCWNFVKSLKRCPMYLDFF